MRKECTLNRPLKKYGRPPKLLSHEMVDADSSDSKDDSSAKGSSVSDTSTNSSVEEVTEPWKQPRSPELLIQQLSYTFSLNNDEKGYMERFIRFKAAMLLGTNTELFVLTVVPLAFTLPCVKYTILAISLASEDHLEAYRDSQKYRSLAKFDRSDSPSTEIRILELLMLVLMEIVMGDGMESTLYLEKLEIILNQLPNWLHERNSQLHQMLVQLYSYFQLLMRLNFGYSIREVPESSFCFAFGLSQPTLQIIAQIHTLQKMRDQGSMTETDALQFSSLLEIKIQAHSTISQLSAALNCSCYLQMYQLRSSAASSQLQENCLAVLLETVQKIPKTEPRLLYPLMVAGSVATKRDHQEYILRRIKDLQSFLKYPFVSRYQDLLLYMWQSKTPLSATQNHSPTGVLKHECKPFGTFRNVPDCQNDIADYIQHLGQKNGLPTRMEEVSITSCQNQPKNTNSWSDCAQLVNLSGAVSFKRLDPKQISTRGSVIIVPAENIPKTEDIDVPRGKQFFPDSAVEKVSFRRNVVSCFVVLQSLSSKQDLFVGQEDRIALSWSTWDGIESDDSNRYGNDSIDDEHPSPTFKAILHVKRVINGTLQKTRGQNAKILTNIIHHRTTNNLINFVPTSEKVHVSEIARSLKQTNEESHGLQMTNVGCTVSSQSEQTPTDVQCWQNIAQRNFVQDVHERNLENNGSDGEHSLGVDQIVTFHSDGFFHSTDISVVQVGLIEVFDPIGHQGVETEQDVKLDHQFSLLGGIVLVEPMCPIQQVNHTLSDPHTVIGQLGIAAHRVIIGFLGDFAGIKSGIHQDVTAISREFRMALERQQFVLFVYSLVFASIGRSNIGVSFGKLSNNDVLMHFHHSDGVFRVVGSQRPDLNLWVQLDLHKSHFPSFWTASHLHVQSSCNDLVSKTGRGDRELVLIQTQSQKVAKLDNPSPAERNSVIAWSPKSPNFLRVSIWVSQTRIATNGGIKVITIVPAEEDLILFI
ncbi:hypothetical protein OGAPHI_006350 [Ogataea philodendri]|uniref:Uncharacterized protein n=2 Tax=Ogataea TaxID=461281 RepID=A0A9P8T085_9ASCO|nr:uncharacterized protein OGAPHI_006350 [Ogataea philodendri]KAH3661503.1 hypothetical protein OGAPHI_006350 [Ogataea philodendri]